MERVGKAARYTELGQAEQTVVEKIALAGGIVEFKVRAPMVARSAQAGQFVRVLGWRDGELIPLTLADWDAEEGTIDLVIQGMGTSTLLMNKMAVGDKFAGIAGPLGRASELHKYAHDETVVFTAGGVGLPPVYPIARAHLRLGNHVTLISGFRSKDFLFWVGEEERVGKLQAEFGRQLDVIYTSNDGTFGEKGFVTAPLERMLRDGKKSKGRKLAEVVTIGPPMMMRAVQRPHQAVRREDRREPQLDHGGRHRHVRRLHGADHGGRQADPQARLHRRPGDRRPPYRLGQVPAALHHLQVAGAAQQGGARAGLAAGPPFACQENEPESGICLGWFRLRLVHSQAPEPSYAALSGSPSG